MMNPGSSSPIDEIDDNIVASSANPYPTQKQVTSVMQNTDFEFARILNLSDVRMTPSNRFYEFLGSDKSELFPHSIF
ncbi:MAG: hypothetical protein ACI9J2_001317 [Saprospiraceae bacterium]|jgi:hypothetical protein